MEPSQAPRNGAIMSAAKGIMPAWPTLIPTQYSCWRPGGITTLLGSQVGLKHTGRRQVRSG